MILVHQVKRSTIQMKVMNLMKMMNIKTNTHLYSLVSEIQRLSTKNISIILKNATNNSPGPTVEKLVKPEKREKLVSSKRKIRN